MARREIIYTVQDDNRDKGKQFVITEMTAFDGEWWAIRAMMALSRGGEGLDIDPQSASLYDLAMVGLRGLPYASAPEIKPLLDEMTDCITVKPDASNPALSRKLVASDVEEISTLLDLRQEWIRLHLGFLKPGAP